MDVAPCFAPLGRSHAAFEHSFARSVHSGLRNDISDLLTAAPVEPTARMVKRLAIRDSNGRLCFTSFRCMLCQIWFIERCRTLENEVSQLKIQLVSKDEALAQEVCGDSLRVCCCVLETRVCAAVLPETKPSVIKEVSARDEAACGRYGGQVEGAELCHSGTQTRGVHSGARCCAPLVKFGSFVTADGRKIQRV